MDDRSYIKLFHKMLTWGWYGDTNTVRVFLHILLKANYKPSEYRGYKLEPGDCIFGRKEWSKALGLSEQEIRTAINHLKSTTEITTKSTNKFTVIHVEKWEFWQIEEGGATNKSPTIQPTSNQQLTTSKEYKNTTTNTTTNKGRPQNVEEVRAYVAEKGLQIDADYFFEYYEESNWIKSNGKPVSNWKLTAQTWNKREQKEQKAKNEDTRTRTESRPASHKDFGDFSDFGEIHF